LTKLPVVSVEVGNHKTLSADKEILMNKISLAGLALISAFAIAACDQGPAERAGERVDDAGDRVERTFDAATGNEGAMERGGRAVDEAYEDTRDAVQDTYEDVRN